MKVGDIVRMNFTKLGKRILPDRYVVVAIPPTNNLVKGCVDIIRFEDASLPLKKTGIGVPTKAFNQSRQNRITNEAQIKN